MPNSGVQEQQRSREVPAALKPVTPLLAERAEWPGPVRAAADLILASPFPMFVLWGPERTLFYNEAYVPILGAHHPGAIGRGFFEVWPEVRTVIEPVIDAAFDGRSSLFEDLPVVLDRGEAESAWFTFSYSPIPGENGTVAGVLCVCMETTQTVRARHRQAFLIDLEAELRALADPADIIAAAQAALGRHLAANRVGYGSVDESERYFTTSDNWTDGSVPHHNGTHDLAAFGADVFGAIRRGETLVVRDAAGDPRASGSEATAAFEALQIRSAITASLIKNGRLAAAIYVHTSAPRSWTGHDAALVEAVAERTWSAVERALAEASLRSIAERQSFLLALGDRIREISDPTQIKAIAAQALGNHLRVGRAGYGEIDASEQLVTVENDWTDGAAASLAGETRELDVFGPAIIARLRAGEVLRLDDIAADPISAAYAEGYQSIGTRSLVVVPLIKDGRFTAILYLHEGAPRLWSDEEVALAREVAERTWAAVERARAQAALRRLNERLETEVGQRTLERDRMWRLSQDIFLVMTAEGMIQSVNPAVSVLGYAPADMAGKSTAAFVHEADVGALRRAIGEASSGFVRDVETRVRDAAGNWRWFSWNATANDGMIHAVGRDVTAEKARRAELELVHEALRQSQKLEAMGQLTGGVAHDFNNLLTPIIGSLDMLGRKELGPREARLVNNALQSADRAKTLVQRLLAFARRQPLQPRAVDIAALVRSMRDLVASTSGPRIKLDLALEDGVPAAQADPNQLEMALLNLSVNARDAMPEGGTLSFSVEARRLGAENEAGLREGDYVRLSVADTGVGMDEETRRRAIEPFFSTKGIGQGTGLGLSMVHGLASQLGGALTISSKPGLGTRIDIWLPASAEEIGASQANSGERAVATSSGTALLVDDDAAVRAITADMMAELGYKVVEAASADEALTRLRGGLRPDLLVTDHLMPGLTGTELAREARTIWPGLRTVIVSGYAEVEAIAPDLPRLTKPFRQSELAAILEAVSVSS